MSGFPFDYNEQVFPGMSTILETVQNQIWWEGPWHNMRLPITLSSATVDSQNTVTTTLRAGLLLGKITATGLFKEWNPTGTDGSEVIAAVLAEPISVAQGSSTADRYTGNALFCGNLYSDRIVVPGTAAEGISGHAREYQILAQLWPRFWLDKHIQQSPLTLGSPRFRYLTAAEITADAVTVTEADNGKTFLMTGADATTTFTLPAAEVGLTFRFMANIAQTITIAVASGNIAIPGNVAATGASLSAGESATFIGVSAGLYQMISNTEATD